jgi:hypothetical protein
VLFVFSERGRTGSSSKAKASSGRFFPTPVAVANNPNHLSVGVHDDKVNVLGRHLGTATGAASGQSKSSS